MVINVLICIVSAILMLRGLFLVLKMGLVWMIHHKIIDSYGKKTHGKVVDIEIRVKSDGVNTTDLYIPKIKYKLEGENEKCCSFTPFTLESEEGNNVHLYPKCYHKGDKVTIYYDNENNMNGMFVLPRMQIMKLFGTHFVLGCFFILSAVLGLCFVF